MSLISWISQVIAINPTIAHIITKPRSLASGVNQGDVRRSEPKDGSSFGSRSNQGDIRAYDNAQSAKEKADAAELYRESNRPNSKPKDEPSKSTSLASRVNQGDVRRSEPVTKSETNTGAVTGRVDKVSKNMPSAAKKEENTENANWIFAIRIVGKTKSIEETTDFFKSHNVDIRPFFYPINKHGHLTSIQNNDEISVLLNKEIIMIPSSPTITIDEQKIVVDVVNRFLQTVN